MKASSALRDALKRLLNDMKVRPVTLMCIQEILSRASWSVSYDRDMSVRAFS